MASDSIRKIASNKKAFHDYFVLESYEAGIELFGTEVKSIRLGHCSIKEAYIRPEGRELFVEGMHVSPYEKGNIFNKDPLRRRKLLMHRGEIERLLAKVSEKGLALIPLEVYMKGSRVKLSVGLCRGKKLYDKREDLAKKAERRELERDFKKTAFKI